MTKLFVFVSIVVWINLQSTVFSLVLKSHSNNKLYNQCCNFSKNLVNGESNRMKTNISCDNLQINDKYDKFKQLTKWQQKVCRIFAKSCCIKEKRKQLCIDGAEKSTIGNCSDKSIYQDQIKAECCMCCQDGGSILMDVLPNCVTYLKGKCPKPKYSYQTTTTPTTHLTSTLSSSTDVPESTNYIPSTQMTDIESTSQSITSISSTKSTKKNAITTNNSPKIKCSPGQVWDKEMSVCKQTLISCPENFILNPSTQKCVIKRYPTVPCKKGFEYNQIIDKCVDIDECARKDIFCNNTLRICKNEIGSYKCLCKAGYKEDNSGKCLDIDECLTVNCPVNRKCINTMGSYRCGRRVGCGFGWAESLETAECVDVNECTSFKEPVCGAQMKCINIEGSFLCVKVPCPPNMWRNKYDECKRCRTGYKFNNKTQKCEDIDECESNTARCRESERCINSLGSYECYPKISCYEGTRISRNGTNCEDIDECQEHTFTCKPDEICINVYSSYHCVLSKCPPSSKYDYRSRRCECAKGFRRISNGKCEDINECLEIPGICGSNTNCKNRQGSYTCIPKSECPKGLFKLPKSSICLDIDECLSNKPVCGPNQYCRNVHQSYECHCERGFNMLPNKTCGDINECFLFTQEEACPDPTSRCVNFPGSYKCECKKGFYFSLSKKKCLDVDECREKHRNGTFKEPCGPNQGCQNLVGTYKCECLSGYEFNKYTGICVDKNECNDKRQRCINGKCINLNGSYKCKCPKGFQLNSDENCIDVNECTAYKDLCDHIHTRNLLKGNPEEKTCVNFYGHYKCISSSCPKFYTRTLLGNGILCQLSPHMNCKANDHLCLNNRPLQRELIYVELKQNNELFTKLAHFTISNLPTKDTETFFRVIYAYNTETGRTINARTAFRFRKIKYRQDHFEVLQIKRLEAPAEVLIQIRTRIFVKTQFLGYTQSNLLIFFTKAKYYYN